MSLRSEFSVLCPKRAQLDAGPSALSRGTMARSKQEKSGQGSEIVPVQIKMAQRLWAGASESSRLSQKYQATPPIDLSAGSHYSTLWAPYAKGR